MARSRWRGRSSRCATRWRSRWSKRVSSCARRGSAPPSSCSAPTTTVIKTKSSPSGLTPVVYDRGDLEKFAGGGRAPRASGRRARQDRHRDEPPGDRPGASSRRCWRASPSSRRLRLAGLCTHFASADLADAGTTEAALAQFGQGLDAGRAARLPRSRQPRRQQRGGGPLSGGAARRGQAGAGALRRDALASSWRCRASRGRWRLRTRVMAVRDVAVGDRRQLRRDLARGAAVAGGDAADRVRRRLPAPRAGRRGAARRAARPDRRRGLHGHVDDRRDRSARLGAGRAGDADRPRRRRGDHRRRSGALGGNGRATRSCAGSPSACRASSATPP